MARSKASVVLTVITALVMGVPKAGAAWLYDPGERIKSGATLYGPQCPYRGSKTPYWASQRFYLPRDAEINQLGAGLARGYDPEGIGFTVSLVSDIYDIEGSTLGEWKVSPSGPSTQWYYWTTDSIRLNAYQEYAIVIRPGSDEMYGSVAWASAGLYQLQLSADQGATWADTYPYAAAIRINGFLVPEPASALPISLALGCLFFELRLICLNTYRKQVRSNKIGV